LDFRIGLNFPGNWGKEEDLAGRWVTLIREVVPGINRVELALLKRREGLERRPKVKVVQFGRGIRY